MKLSIIICTYNRSSLLKRALLSLDDQDMDQEYEIIVVDDGSTDDTELICRDLKLNNPFNYCKREHLSRSAARNHGIKISKGEYVVFVDDDIIAPRGLIREHLNNLMINDKIIVRGPIIDVPDFDCINQNKIKLKDFSMAFFCTCNSSLKKDILLKIGGFDEDFTEYGWEDTELGLMLRKYGCRVKFSMDAYLYHYKPIYDGKLNDEINKANELARMAVKFLKKHNDLRVRLAVGSTFLQLLWNSMIFNSFVKNKSIDMIENKKRKPELYYILIRNVFSYYYYKTLKVELIKNR